MSYMPKTGLSSAAYDFDDSPNQQQEDNYYTAQNNQYGDEQ